MPSIKKLLAKTQIKLDSDAPSKKRALEQASEMLSQSPEREEAESIFERLLERERLGSTGLVNGFALPHARLAGVMESGAAFIRLQQGVDFDSMDDQPADLVFTLLVPEEATDEHLSQLRGLAKLFNQSEFCSKVREAETEQQVLQLFDQYSEDDAD